MFDPTIALVFLAGVACGWFWRSAARRDLTPDQARKIATILNAAADRSEGEG